MEKKTEGTIYAGTKAQQDMVERSRAYHTTLRRGRTGRLRLLERVSLSIRGRQDGRMGLPKEAAEGSWDSPILAGERAAYEEFCADTWARHQVSMKEQQEKVRNLTERITRLEGEIGELDREIRELDGEEPEVFRKFGEENISEAQVQLRRKREHDRQTDARRQVRKELEWKISEAREERERSRNRILEADHAVRLLCEKVGDHTRMRMAAYWSAALKEHKEAERVPASPNLEIPNDAERIYLSGHKEFYNRISK